MRLSDEEITRLAAFLHLPELEFIEHYTRLRPDRRGLALRERPNGECILLKGNDCAVQAVKPQQCRDFPNLWNFPGFEKSCHAIPRMVEKREYVRLVSSATKRPEDDIRERLNSKV